MRPEVPPLAEPPPEIRGDRYELLRALGKGGWGVVWKARDRQLDRDVALKELRAPLDSNARRRFEREARATAGAHHPHLVRVLDFDPGDDARAAYIVYELIEGGTLEQWMGSDTRPTPRELVRVGREVAGALGALHAEDVVHRDVKPPNILLRKNGEAVLADLGLALLQHDPAALTPTGQIVGTPAYMAPECWLGYPPDARSDQFALGASLFRAATGTSIYPSNDLGEVARRIAEGWEKTLTQEEAGRLGEPLASACRRALAPLATQRFPSMQDFAEALADPGTTDIPVTPRVGSPSRSQPVEILRSKLDPPATPDRPGPSPLRWIGILLAAALCFGLGRWSAPPRPAPATHPEPGREPASPAPVGPDLAERAARLESMRSLLASHRSRDGKLALGLSDHPYEDHVRMVIDEYLEGRPPLTRTNLIRGLLQDLAAPEADVPVPTRREILMWIYHAVFDHYLVRGGVAAAGLPRYDSQPVPLSSEEVSALNRAIDRVHEDFRGVGVAPSLARSIRPEAAAAMAIFEGALLRDRIDQAADDVLGALRRAPPPDRPLLALASLTLLQPLLLFPNGTTCETSRKVTEATREIILDPEIPAPPSFAQDLRCNLVLAWYTTTPRCEQDNEVSGASLAAILHALEQEPARPSRLGQAFLRSCDSLERARALLFSGTPSSANPSLRRLQELRARWFTSKGDNG